MKKYTKAWMLSNCSKAGKSKSEKKLRAINENLKKARAMRWLFHARTSCVRVLVLCCTVHKKSN